MQRPDVERIEGLSPTIAIEQRPPTASPRSTVATTTEIYDYLRVLFARAGEPRCPRCNSPIVQQSIAQIVDAVLEAPEGQRFLVLAPLVQEQRGAHRPLLEQVLKQGFVRVRVDGVVSALEKLKPLSPAKKHTLEVVVDRLVARPAGRQRLADSVELATTLSGGRVIIALLTADDTCEDHSFSSTLACPLHPEVRVDDLSPRLFSFNSPHGACPECHGLGITMEFDEELVVPDRDLCASPAAPWPPGSSRANA